MEKADKAVITVRATIHAPIEKVWKCWTTPGDIVQWNAASDNWHTTSADNDLRVGGTFTYRMEAKDGSMGFDFAGTYDQLIVQKQIAFTLGDERTVSLTFSPAGGSTEIVESFEAEQTHPLELQRAGWQSILDNFKKFVESHHEKGT